MPSVYRDDRWILALQTYIVQVCIIHVMYYVGCWYTCVLWAVWCFRVSLHTMEQRTERHAKFSGCGPPCYMYKNNCNTKILLYCVYYTVSKCYVHLIICHWAILHYNMSFKTIAERSDGVCWWFPALSEDQEKNSWIHQNYLVALKERFNSVQDGASAI